MTFCKLALVPTKEPAVELVRELEEAFPEFDGKIRVNPNGCPNSCARYQLSDIGLAGGESAGEGNYQLHLGGDLGEGLAFGHRVRERVLAVDTGAVVKGLVAGYLEGREAGESPRPGCAASHRDPGRHLQAGPVGAPDGVRVPGAAGADRPAGGGGRRLRRRGRQGRGPAGRRGRGHGDRQGPGGGLTRLSDDPRVTIHRRGYRGPADLAGTVLCVASAAEPGVRDAIAADARAAGVLVNVMDDVNCDFAAPAIVRRGDLVIAVGTGGRAPALASRVRAELGERFGPEWTELLEVVGRVRAATLPPARLRGPFPPLEGRPRPGRAGAPGRRRPGRSGRHPPPRPPAGGGGVSGVVYLVGAGPGDPRLLTLRGAEVLQRADVVVYDRLARRPCSTWPARGPSGSTPARPGDGWRAPRRRSTGCWSTGGGAG